MRSSSLAVVVIATLGLLACASETSDPEETVTPDNSADELRVRGQAAWFYSGPIPTLESPTVTVSQKGHTARVQGLLPRGATVPDAPHVRATEQPNGRVRLDVVYPVATGASYNTAVGTYAFQRAIPYRPDGNTFTYSAGNHWVTWGGFPFLGYNGTIAMHGPITDTVNKTGDANVWFLRRGKVSSGCNRMMGEHVTELAHLIGVDMRKVYNAQQTITPRPAPVTIIGDYDQLDGKYVDIDFPTDVGVVRPGKTYGDDAVAMFGSWVGAELPDGSDLPGDLKWEGGVPGKPYVFKEHATYDWVCSVLPPDLARLKTYAATLPNKTLPADFCQKKDCIVAALAAGTAPAACNAN